MRSAPRNHRAFVGCSLVSLLLVLLLGSAPAAGQSGIEPQAVFYAAPMQTDVADPFRPPAHTGAPGNRGLEYANSDNRVVSAAASGYVAFAGPVAGRKTISIDHADGVRTTYTGLLDIWVVQGMMVNQYSGIAMASTGFHFGARLGEHYLDPQVLIDASDPSAARPILLPPPDE